MTGRLFLFFGKNMKNSDFVHLHTHTQYSLLDGACKLDDLIELALAYKMPSLAITDHGNMFGAIEFYCLAQEKGLKPIIGAELYVAPKSRFDRNVQGADEDENFFHIILLAKDEDGYRSLMKLISRGHLEGFYYKPRIDMELLAENSKGLIALSGCLKGELAHYILKGKNERAKKFSAQINEIFGQGNFYLELQHNLIPEQDKLNRGLLSLSKELNLPIVATNDIHYLHKKDAQAHEILLCLQTQTTLQDEKRLKFQTEEFYFKSPQEMIQIFGEYPQAILNTIDISEKCNLNMEFDKVHLPKYDPPDGLDEGSFLRNLCQEGIYKLYGGFSEKIKQRLEHELKVIEGAGFTSYFLLVWDFVKFAKEKQIPVGPGRGSAAGSLVSYALGITSIDPIKYDLIFERFLNPERISLPDIDIDFCYERRNEVIDYVTKKYGSDKVAQIITFGTMAARGVVRDVGRVMGITYSEVDKIAKLIPQDTNITLKKALEIEPQLKDFYKKDPQIKDLLDTSSALEGLARHASTHAAGVIISREPLTNYTPLFKSTDNQITTGFSMWSLEKIGLLKMDFLGLRTLTMIDETIKIIKRTKEKTIDISNILLDDKAAFEMLSRAESFGVFQLEGSGMRELLKKLKPENFEDIIALLALYRPGPLGSGLVDEFIQRKQGKVAIKYLHPKLKPILENTYGVILHQDQIMVIGIELAGFSFGQAAILMKAIGKKQPDKMEQLKEDFLKGAVERGISSNIAKQIFTLVAHFTGYGFNKAHTTAYAMLAYQTAYLKANYPVEFMTALLSSEKDNPDKIAKYIEATKVMGIKVLPPDVNESYARFTVAGNSIRFGLSAVKNVGGGAVDSIIKNREVYGEFISFNDFCERVDLRAVNRKVTESLIKCGAFDSFNQHRSQLMVSLDKTLEIAGYLAKDRQNGQLSFFDSRKNEKSFKKKFEDMPTIEEWPENLRLSYEKEMIGFYITGHPLNLHKKVLETYRSVSIADVKEFSNQREIILGGVISHVKNTITKKKGERMSIIRLEDLSGGIEVLVFPRAYANSAAYIKEDKTVFIKGRVDAKEELPKIIASEIIPIENVHEKLAEGIIVNLTSSNLNEDLLNELRQILEKNPGQTPVFLNIYGQNGKKTKIKPNSAIKIKITTGLLNTFKEKYGEEAIHFLKNKS